MNFDDIKSRTFAGETVSYEEMLFALMTVMSTFDAYSAETDRSSVVMATTVPL